MIEITVNDRLGKKVRVKCNGDDTIGDLKKLIAAQVRTVEAFSGFLFNHCVAMQATPVVRKLAEF